MYHFYLGHEGMGGVHNTVCCLWVGHQLHQFDIVGWINLGTITHHTVSYYELHIDSSVETCSGSVSTDYHILISASVQLIDFLSQLCSLTHGTSPHLTSAPHVYIKLVKLVVWACLFYFSLHKNIYRYSTHLSPQPLYYSSLLSKTSWKSTGPFIINPVF